MHRISIILPTYNCEKYIGRVLNCLRKQSFKDFLCYVVDTGSSDNTLNAIKNFSLLDPRICLIELKQGNKMDAILTALSSPLGEFVVFVDYYDTLADYFLEELYEQGKTYDITLANIDEQCKTFSHASKVMPLSSEQLFSYALQHDGQDKLACVLIRADILSCVVFPPTSYLYFDSTILLQLAFMDLKILYCNALLLHKVRPRYVLYGLSESLFYYNALSNLAYMLHIAQEHSPKFSTVLNFVLNECVFCASKLLYDQSKCAIEAKMFIKDLCLKYRKYIDKYNALMKFYIYELSLNFRLFKLSFTLNHKIERAWKNMQLFWGGRDKRMTHKEIRELKKQMNRF